MYQPSYPSSQGFTSPPPPGSGPGGQGYRSPPMAGQPYPGFTSPVSPPPPNAFSPMSSGQSQRFQPSQPYAPSSPNTGNYPRQSRYAGQNGYGQMQAPPPPGSSAVGGVGGGKPKYKGTIAPGTMVQVGDHQVRVERYLSEGGYAHVYLTRSEKPIYPPVKGDKKGRWGERGFTEHCLKRIAFEDDSVWTDVKKEIEVMKALPPNPHLVQYLGSSHNRSASGKHEVFILMEFCAGGGIIDLLNKRLRDRLKEAEILNIFTDVCEAVAAMHALKSPLLHRDLKIENVLSTPSSAPSSSQPMGLIFKLCDFGSTTFPASHPPASKVEADAQAMDLNRHTTLQYRSPEMVEPMLGLPVGLPSDVWALGVLLYKLCYYTTPFEEHGTLAIVNAKYTFPQYPVYSPRIQHLIASMLMEQPTRRPTVFDILRVSHDMSGTRPKVDYPDSLSKQLPPQPRPPSSQPPASSRPSTSSSSNLLQCSSPSSSPAPDSLSSGIQPQRRGRPSREPSNINISAKLPPMPQPPAMHSPAPGAPSAPRQQLQVTGDKRTSAPMTKSPSPAASLDAFGMPSASAPGARTQGSASSGFTDSFGSSTKPFRPTSRFGRGLSGHTGFGDSFDASDVERRNAGSLEIPQTASPVSTSARQTPSTSMSSSISTEQSQDLSFESRYPSIETLSSEDTSTPVPRANLISPPPNVSRPSMLGNMTGGDMKQPHQHLAVQTGGPQPRSTNVTGTAFKEQGQGNRGMYTSSPSPVKSRTEYLESTSKSTRPVDLMTGEENEQMGAPLIRRASSTFYQPDLDQAGTGEGAKTPRENERTRPGTLIDNMVDSSDEEEGPESVTPVHTNSTRQQANNTDTEGFKPLSSPTEDAGTSVSPNANRSATLPPVDQFPSISSTGDATIRKRDEQAQAQPRARPQTMYGYSSTSPQKYQSDLPPTQSQGQGRPGHVRKGSINDMVSKFEGLNPSQTASSSSNELSKPQPKPKPKPVVSAKPTQLKKPTLDTVRAEGLQAPILPTSASSASSTSRGQTYGSGTGAGAIPPKPEKAQGLGFPRGGQGHGDAPRPDGYSRSSSGRSFPVVKPKPVTVAQSASSSSHSNGTGNRSGGGVNEHGSRSGSPEKQQSVNSLVARWNQGEMVKKPPIKPKPKALP